MTRSVFDKGISQIMLVSGRSYNDSQKDFFYKKLMYIGDITFEKIIEEYLDELPPPTNIVGYFRKRRDSLSGEKTTFVDDGKSGWQNGEYTKQQENLFMECCFNIQRLPKSFSQEMVMGFVEILNKQWMDNSGDRLTNVMESCLKEIQSW